MTRALFLLLLPTLACSTTAVTYGVTVRDHRVHRRALPYAPRGAERALSWVATASVAPSGAPERAVPGAVLDVRASGAVAIAGGGGLTHEVAWRDGNLTWSITNTSDEPAWITGEEPYRARVDFEEAGVGLGLGRNAVLLPLDARREFRGSCATPDVATPLRVPARATVAVDLYAIVRGPPIGDSVPEGEEQPRCVARGHILPLGLRATEVDAMEAARGAAFTVWLATRTASVAELVEVQWALTAVRAQTGDGAEAVHDRFAPALHQLGLQLGLDLGAELGVELGALYQRELVRAGRFRLDAGPVATLGFSAVGSHGYVGARVLPGVETALGLTYLDLGAEYGMGAAAPLRARLGVAWQVPGVENRFSLNAGVAWAVVFEPERRVSTSFFTSLGYSLGF